MTQFKTRITELLNIEYPLLQGAMAWIAGGKLAGAVSAAGGLGIIGAAGANPAWVKEQIALVRQVTDRPFGVNLMLAAENIDAVMDTVIAERVPVVTTGGGNPGKYIEALKVNGAKVIPVVPSIALARRLERLGVDAFIAEGTESGGHIGEMTTMALVPMVVDAVSVPVIAAGGIADGRGFMAALALGADGVQIGTRFICAEECNAHPNYQQRVIRSKDRDTVETGRSTGHPIRGIRNQFTRQYLQAEKAGANKEELEALGKGRYPSAAIDGNIDEGSVLAGQICALVEKVEPAAAIVADIIQGAQRVQKRMEGI